MFCMQRDQHSSDGEVFVCNDRTHFSTALKKLLDRSDELGSTTAAIKSLRGDPDFAGDLTMITTLTHASNPEKHSPECLAAFAKYRAIEAKFKADYPRYCITCGGHGGIYSSYDPSPAGVSLSSGSYLEFDDCGDCLGRSDGPVCCLCEQSIPVDVIEAGDQVVFPCGHQSGQGLPETPECACWYEADR